MNKLTSKNYAPIIDITDTFGRYGPWQRRVFIFMSTVSIFSAMHNLAISFFAPNIDHWCSRPPEYQNMSVDQWKNFTIPLIKDDDGKTSFSKCQMFSFPSLNSTNNETDVIDCPSWEYEDSFYISTIVSKWNLVCDKEWAISMSQSAFMGGYMTAVMVFGQLSDRIGRRPVIVIAVTIFLLSGITCLFATSFMMFAILRFFISFGVSGTGGTAFVLLMEAVGPEFRSFFGLAFNFGWALGYIILPGLAWLIRDWYYLQVAITVPCFLLLLFWWYVPESPRWLVASRRFEEAENVILCAANKNNFPEVHAKTTFHQMMDDIQKEEGHQEKKRATVFDLLKTPCMRRKSLNLFFCWFVNSFIYFGLSLNTNDLGGDPFINFFIAGAVEFPAYIFAIGIIKWFGRRIPQMALMIAGGLSCLLTIPFTHELLWLRITLAMVGKFCITASFGIIYVFSAEVFPTVVRNVGVGSSSTCARVGSMIAPFVKELGRATHKDLPFAMFGTMSVVSGLMVLWLPETHKKILPDTLEEGEIFGLKGSSLHNSPSRVALQDETTKTEDDNL
ncbi:organic cation transporter protein-like [Limulus polyphemus]|uniref:Organic cation transporter protein-like n=1 Tax=Limulus polyphemus TaxID=6850 RepID=A0ABM1SM73_LIMPO|nr:organic cation transporter protein-like [Limulus polyphemus]